MLILEQPLFTAVELSQVLGARGGGNRTAAARVRARGDIIGLEVQGRFLFPAFQFDIAEARVHPVVAEVNRLLDALSEPWGVALWWLTTQGRTTPIDLIGQGEKRLRSLAAAAEVG